MFSSRHLVKPRRLRWAGLVACMRDEKPRRIEPIWETKCRRADNIKVFLKEIMFKMWIGFMWLRIDRVPLNTAITYQLP
jgi:hypothetical protein